MGYISIHTKGKVPKSYDFKHPSVVWGDFIVWGVYTKRRLQIVVSKCLRRIMNIKWTDKITNEEL